METGCVYIGTVNDLSYIGYTKRGFEKRKKEHLEATDDYYFHRAIRKHGPESVEWRILEDDIPIHRLPDREELWIAFYNTYYDGYNMNEGGSVSPMSDHEVAAKVTKAQHEKLEKGEHHLQIDNPMLNPEVAARVTDAQQEKVAKGEHHLQTDNPMLDPKIAAKQGRINRINTANKRLSKWKEAGQNLLFELFEIKK